MLQCAPICLKCQVWISTHRPALHQYFQMKSVLHFLGQYVTDSVHRPCNQVCTNFLKIYEPLKILGVRKNDMRTVSNRRSASTRSHNTKFGHRSELAPWICALLLIIKYFSINIIRFTHYRFAFVQHILPYLHSVNTRWYSCQWKMFWCLKVSYMWKEIGQWVKFL